MDTKRLNELSKLEVEVGKKLGDIKHSNYGLVAYYRGTQVGGNVLIICLPERTLVYNPARVYREYGLKKNPAKYQILIDWLKELASQRRKLCLK